MRTLKSHKISLVVLAAGKSERMGKPKLLLPLPNRMCFLENIVFTYLTLGIDNIVVVVNNQVASIANQELPCLKQKISLVVNNNVERGRFFSLKLGLMNRSSNNATLVHNVDNPLVIPEVIYDMVDVSGSTNFVYPSYKGKGGHPVLISSNVCEKIINERLDTHILKNYLKRHKGINVPVNHPAIIQNINTKQEYLEFINRWFNGA